MSNVAYIPVIGQSMVDAWFTYPSVLQAFKDEFLKLRPEFTDVVLYDAARGGSATTEAAALAYATIRGGEGTDAYNAVLNNYWVTDDLTDGTDLQLFLPRLATWAAGKTIFGAIFDLGETDSVWMNSPERLAEQKAATDYLLSRIESVIGPTTFYVQAVGDRAFYKQANNSGADPMHAFQQDYAATHDNFRLASETYDLPTIDSIHLTEAGFIEAAIRMADAMALGTTTATEDFVTAATNGNFYVSLDLPDGVQLADLSSTNAFRIIAPDGSSVGVKSVVVDKASHVLVITPATPVAGATLQYASATYSFNLGHDDFVYAGNNPLHPFTVTLSAAHESITATANGYVITDDSGAHLVQGFAGDDILYGNAGNDTLDGGAGADVMSGGTGDDHYVIDNIADTVFESAASGIDTVHSSVTFTLGNNVENLELTGTAAINGTGNALANVINGNDQSNQLDGGDGNDVIYGNGGRDVIFGGNGDDRLYAGDGGGGMEGGAGNDTLIGGAGPDGLDGGTGNDTIDGGAGFDTAVFASSANGVHVSLAITGPQDTGEGMDMLVNIEALFGSVHDDVMIGSSGDNDLDGSDGNDVIDGGAGADRMFGGKGDDTYVVDNPGDSVSEIHGDGIDTVLSSVSFALAPRTDPSALDNGVGIENLVLTGSAAIDGTGNDLDNVLTGNAAANKLFGGEGNDTLDGGAGNDRMSGGWGNDIYYVDSYDDKIIEAASEGTDSVFATTNYKLSANVENLTLQGSAQIWGYGNDLDNMLIGNDAANKLYGLAGNDVIDGKGGSDIMVGGVGNDTYYVDSYGDRVVENVGEGTDSVMSTANYKLSANIEKLTLRGTADLWGYGNDIANVLTGNDGSNKLYGLEGNDKLNGRGGDDWLEGGAGQDHLTGGAGADSFVFRDGDFGGATVATADEITDFTHGEDHIRLNFIDANTLLTGDQAFAFLGAAAFGGHAGELRYEQISGDTYVEGDTNGDGVADFMIRVDGMHALTSGDFSL